MTNILNWFQLLNHKLGARDCFNLEVPKLDDVSNFKLRWRMQFQDLPDYKVDVEKEVAVNRVELEPLIQTDKAWYTPGQLVRFRILSLDHKLRPILDPVSYNPPNLLSTDLIDFIVRIRSIAFGLKIPQERPLLSGPMWRQITELFSWNCN